tara:strand:- start:787 stop:966 length:180 start_codon:yes stop_codon:yes gene_type:complete
MIISEVDRIIMLVEEIGILKSRFKPEDTGHIRTAVSVLEDRVQELRDRMEDAGRAPAGM